MAAHRKSDRRHDDLYAGGLRKRVVDLVDLPSSMIAPWKAPDAGLGIDNKAASSEICRRDCSPGSEVAMGVDRVTHELVDGVITIGRDPI